MEKVDVVYGESRGRLRRKCRSLTEEVGMVVVNRESGDRLERKWELWSLKENRWLWSLTEKVDVIYGGSENDGC